MRRYASLVFLLIVMGGMTNAQELTHPRDMGLPDSDYVRPDPTDYELTLENGLTAFVARADQVPLVTLSAFVRVGLVDDSTQGAAEALQDALTDNGPSTMSGTQFQSTLKSMIADYSVELHDEWTEITLNVTSDDFEVALQLFADILRFPSIQQNNIDAAATRIEPTEKDLGGEAGPALYEGSLNAAVSYYYDAIYTNHLYGVKPNAADFAALNVEDVVSHHSTYFVPGNVTLAIAGNIDVDDVHLKIESLFADWSADDVPDPIRMPNTKRLRSAQHNYPVDKLQSWLVFGHDLPPVPVADQAALEVMNYILAGGHLWTRMTIETRYKYGYTNDASGFLEDKWFGPGGYNFRSYSRPDVIKAIYDNMMAEIDRIRSERVTDDELFVAAGALTEGRFQVGYLDGYSTTRNFALERLRYRNHTRSASYVNRIRAVTADDVLAAARKYLRPDEMQVVLVGKEEDLLD